MTTAAGRGHPRHQLRQFTVTVRCAGQRPEKLHVQAQTEPDAILQAGMDLTRRHPDADPANWITANWIVTGITDPAPFTWIPGEKT